jgi:hypothetical protein
MVGGQETESRRGGRRYHILEHLCLPNYQIPFIGCQVRLVCHGVHRTNFNACTAVYALLELDIGCSPAKIDAVGRAGFLTFLVLNIP